MKGLLPVFGPSSTDKVPFRQISPSPAASLKDFSTLLSATEADTRKPEARTEADDSSKSQPAGEFLPRGRSTMPELPVELIAPGKSPSPPKSASTSKLATGDNDLVKNSDKLFSQLNDTFAANDGDLDNEGEPAERDRKHNIPATTVERIADPSNPNDALNVVSVQFLLTLPAPLQPVEKRNSQIAFTKEPSSTAMIDDQMPAPQVEDLSSLTNAVGTVEGISALKTHEHEGPRSCTMEAVPFQVEIGLEPEGEDAPPAPAKAQAPQIEIASLPLLMAPPDAVIRLVTASAAMTPANQIIQRLTQVTQEEAPFAWKAGEVRALRLHLRPADLGDVAIVLRQTGHETRIHISVDRESVAQLLKRDMDQLRDQLGSMLNVGTTRGITITVQSDSQPNSSTSHSEQHMQNHHGSFGDQAETGGRRPSSDKDYRPIMRRPDDRDDETPARRRSASGLVV